MTRYASILAFALLLVLGGHRAHAHDAVMPSAERQARSLFQRGEDHFRAGLFAEALAEYQAGYDIAPLPGFLINIAQCQRRLGHLDQALVTYRKFMMVAPDSRFVPQVTSLIAELEGLLNAAQAAEAAEAAATDEDAEAPSTARPSTEPLTPAPPPRAAEADRPALLAAPLPTAPPPRAHTRWWLWGGMAAVVVAGTAAFFALRSPEATTVHDGTLGTLRR